MDFFHYQEQARRKTKQLALYFGLAVVGIILSVYFAFVATFLYSSFETRSSYESGEFPWWQPEILLAVSAATILLVGISSAMKVLTLRAGGSKIAESLGGRLVERDGADLDEIKLLNIVEEMAIASGVPVPPVYLLEQQGINAFAAGYTINDAVVGVTRGAIKSLNRDELQGVIAHEFSHILNGDMRININLMGLLYGIVVLTVVGELIIRSSNRRTGRKNDKGGAPVVIFGIALWLIGMIGSFFAKVIKSAISRQREFLADSAAVQFTRNPLGIGGALAKILSGDSGAKVDHERATEVSHMFFANFSQGFLSGLFSTHPPLRERIVRLGLDLDQIGASKEEQASSSKAIPAEAGLSALSPETGTKVFGTAQIDKNIGQLNQQQLNYAQQLISSIPDNLRTKLSHPAESRLIVLALLVYSDRELSGQEIGILDSVVTDQELGEIKQISKELVSLDMRLRLPILELATVSLKKLTLAEYKSFRGLLAKLIELGNSDKQLSSFEYTLTGMIFHNLDRFYGLADQAKSENKSLSNLTEAAAVIFQLLLQFAGSRQRDQSEIIGKLNDQLGVKLDPIKETLPTIDSYSKAIDQLSLLSPSEKKRLIQCCIEVIFYDREVSVNEAELFRALAESLSVPIPPIMADKA